MPVTGDGVYFVNDHELQIGVAPQTVLSHATIVALQSTFPGKPAMRSARSRTGCLTCRTKKVKCDEQTPECRRCQRLDLRCAWTLPSGKSRLAPNSRRRDKPAWPKILPKADHSTFCFQGDSLDPANIWPASLDASLPNTHEDARQQLLPENGYIFPISECDPSYFGADDWFPELVLPFDPICVQEPTDPGVTQVSAPAVVADALSSSPDTISSSTTQLEWLQKNEAAGTLSITTLGANWQNIALSQTFSQTGRETEGLHYYTTVYPTMTVSKDVNWTTYRIILLTKSQDPLTMHFLMAASLIDLATLKNYDPTICRAARSHARAGMLLLEEALDPEAMSDPVAVLTASFFLYRYMAIAKELEPSRMVEWSRNICGYVERNRLDDMCGRTEPGAVLSPAKHGNTQESLSRPMRVHLARLILWTFYEDIFAGIGGYGGFLARRMCDEPLRARDLYRHSSAELECFWGKDYPEREIIDDIENAPIIAFLYEVMALYAEVNKLAASPYRSAEDVAALEAKIDKLETCSGSLLRLTTITVQPRSRVMLNADYMVPYFYALRIYFYRCFLQDDDLEVAAPTAIQSCISSIVQLAQRCLSRGPSEAIKSRFQWSLFMAGIETTDNVYKEWINSKFKSARVSAAFTYVINLQDRTGKRASMSLLTRILGGKSSAPNLEID